MQMEMHKMLVELKPKTNVDSLLTPRIYDEKYPFTYAPRPNLHHLEQEVRGSPRSSCQKRFKQSTEYQDVLKPRLELSKYCRSKLSLESDSKL